MVLSIQLIQGEIAIAADGNPIINLQRYHHRISQSRSLQHPKLSIAGTKQPKSAQQDLD
jgi:hypothetical protein